jgi:hypothetical protein
MLDTTRAYLEIKPNKKLDKVQWKERISFTSFGVKITVLFDCEEIVSQITPYLPPFAIITDPHEISDFTYSVIVARETGKFNFIYRNGEQISKWKERGKQVLERKHIFTTLEVYFQTATANFAVNQGVFIHAGAVAWKDKGIIIPANSYDGKTTLTAEFARLGATYFSDEYAIINHEGKLLPYPKTLSIRKPDEYEQTEKSIEELGGKGANISDSVPVKLILLAKFRKNNKVWKPKQLTQADGVMELLKHTFPVRTFPEIVLKNLHNLTKNAIVLKGNRGEAKEFAKQIINYLEKS